MKTFKLSKPAVIMAFNLPLSPAKELAKVQQLAGLPAKQVEGVWLGDIEQSYVFTPHSQVDTELLIDLAVEYDQDAILYLDQYRNALLVPADQYKTFLYMVNQGLSTHIIGEQIRQEVKTWARVKEDQAKAADCYTFDPSTDQYYLTV